MVVGSRDDKCRHPHCHPVPCGGSKGFPRVEFLSCQEVVKGQLFSFMASSSVLVCGIYRISVNSHSSANWEWGYNNGPPMMAVS